MHGTSMCHILDTLLHAGNCMADKSESGGGSDDPAFPCEDPTQPELEDWLKCMRDKLKKTEYLYLTRNETPPSLIGISVGIDLGMMQQQLAPAGDETTDAFQKRSAWNFKCETKAREENQRELSFTAGIAKMKNGFAGRIADTMRINAPAKLRQLKVAHEMGSDTDMHDGAAMWLAIESLKSKPSATHQRSADWHEKQWEIMRDTPLPDHCGVQAYLAKVTRFCSRSTSRTSKRLSSGGRISPT